MKGGVNMEYKSVVKLVNKTSKNGNAYTVAEIYVDGRLVKGGIFLNDAEKTLFELLAK